MTARVLAVALGIALAVIAWLLWMRPRTPLPVETPVRHDTPSPATPTVTATPGNPSTYRLAGVAVGDKASFAVFSDAEGRTALYAVGTEVPGLGKLVRVEGRRAFIAGEKGELEFQVRPAPTATPDLRPPSPTPSAAAPALPPARTAAE